MDPVLIPSADTIPVAWGWFQFLLLLTFPLHLLAMNAMLGGLGIGVVQQFMGGDVRKRLSHLIALALPLVIAFVVNLGVAPLLFLQVLYGQFVYTSSILMGLFWILIVPVLIVAYYGAYLYDFRFVRLGEAGRWLALAVFVLLLAVGYFFVSNMLLMSLPDRFADYFQHKAGTMLVWSSELFLPRYLHMITGALAVGGLFVALLGRLRSKSDPELAEHAQVLGMRTFSHLTIVNIGLGTWYLLVQKRETMLLFMGGDRLATFCFVLASLLVLFVLFASFTRRLALSIGGLVTLVFLMSFMRAWLRSDYLADFFNLSQLQVVPEYSPLVFFLLVLAGGLLCIGWLIKRTVQAMG